MGHLEGPPCNLANLYFLLASSGADQNSTLLWGEMSVSVGPNLLERAGSPSAHGQEQV